MNSLDIYQETHVTTQSRGKVIVMLYDGVVKFLKQAILAIEKKDYQAKSRYISKAQDIILELNTVLDMEAGEEISANL